MNCADAHKRGTRNDLQRYRCRAEGCRRTFNALSGRTLAKLNFRTKWADFAELMPRRATTREMGAALGIEHKTAWNWRRRFWERGKLGRPDTLRGIAELDAMFFCTSQKALLCREKP